MNRALAIILLALLALLPTALAAEYTAVVMSCVQADARGAAIPGGNRYVLERVFEDGTATGLRLFTQPEGSTAPSSRALPLPLTAITERFSPYYSFELRAKGVLISYTYGKKHDRTRIAIHQESVPELNMKGRSYRCR